jgi:hypothetical protein
LEYPVPPVTDKYTFGGIMTILASHLLSGLASPELYLDPGSGSILLQLLLAAILGAGVVLRTQWSKIKSLFKGKDSSREDEDDEE